MNHVIQEQIRLTSFEPTEVAPRDESRTMLSIFNNGETPILVGFAELGNGSWDYLVQPGQYLEHSSYCVASVFIAPAPSRYAFQGGETIRRPKRPRYMTIGAG